MNIVWKYSSPIEENVIIKVARSHNIILPALLVKTIMKGNNGSPSKNKFYYDGGHNEDIFKTLLSYNPNDVENVYSALLALKNFPNLYPFGNDPAGNLICLKGKGVVLWKHETDVVIAVSPSLETFFNDLH